MPVSLTIELCIPLFKAGWSGVQYDPTNVASLVAAGAEVVNLQLLYDKWSFNGVSNDNAIATDKEALVPGDTATFANYASYVLDTNGITLDVQGG